MKMAPTSQTEKILASLSGRFECMPAIMRAMNGGTPQGVQVTHTRDSLTAVIETPECSAVVSQYQERYDVALSVRIVEIAGGYIEFLILGEGALFYPVHDKIFDSWGLL